MEYVKTEFSRELSDLLKKHKKTFDSDKTGIYAIDDEIGTDIIIGRGTDGAEDSRDKIIFVRGILSPDTLG